MKSPNPNQLTFAVFLPPVIMPTGDGFKVTPGKPIYRLTAGQLAAQFAVDRDTVYRWRQEGLIPDQFVTRAGKRKLMFSAEIVPLLDQHFKNLHE